MAKDYLTLGPTPCDEPCEQIGVNYDHAKATREHKAYIAQLRRMFPIPESLAGLVSFTVKRFPHDFGTYSEVCVVWETSSDEATEFALNVEGNIPEKWDIHPFPLG